MAGGLGGWAGSIVRRGQTNGQNGATSLFFFLNLDAASRLPSSVPFLKPRSLLSLVAGTTPSSFQPPEHFTLGA